MIRSFCSETETRRALKKVRENVFQALEKNPLLTLPEKEAVLSVLKGILTEQELETI
jgi:hypothetical protein